jgi:putative transposase
VADSSITLVDLLDTAGIDQAQCLRDSLEWLLQQLMEAEVTGQIGAGPQERAPGRTAQRNGRRDRAWQTRLGTVQLAIPKLRQGTYYPSFLEPRRRSEQALSAVIQEAYVLGVSTRKVDALVQTLGMTGVSKSEVSRICAGLDERVEAFRPRRLEARSPYVWLDAKYVKVREGDRVVSMAVVVATGVRADGDREVLGCDVGLSEDAAFWTAFLRSLVARGLHGVQLVISDAHEGLRQAIQTVMQGASWQRCRVHFLKNVLSQVPKAAQAMVSALVRTIFVQPDKATALRQLTRVAEMLRDRYPKAAELLETATEDILAFMPCPSEHWRPIYSTHPLERLNKEIGRRTDVVGIFPNRTAVVRLVGAVLMEQNDEWIAAPRRYFSLESMAKLGTPAPEP